MDQHIIENESRYQISVAALTKETVVKNFIVRANLEVCSHEELKAPPTLFLFVHHFWTD